MKKIFDPLSRDKKRFLENQLENYVLNLAKL